MLISVTEASDHSSELKIKVTEIVERLRHLLPTQSPIKDFVHHNTLHAFEDQVFEEAVLDASSVFGANAYLSLREYRNYFGAGKISQESLLEEIRASYSPVLLSHVFSNGALTGEEFLQKALWNYNEGGLSESVRSKYPRPRSRLMRLSGLDFNRVVSPILIRYLGSYLDQGISIWKFPATELGFYGAILRLVHRSKFPLTPFVKKSEVLKYQSDGKPWDSETAVENFLEILCPKVSERQFYIQEALLSHPGWSGMVSVLERNPTSLRAPRPICLMDFLAVQLLFEVQALRHSKNQSHFGSHSLTSENLDDPENSPSTPLSEEMEFFKASGYAVTGVSLAAVWHRALERTTYKGLLRSMAEQIQKGEQQGVEEKLKITALFCLDDREGSLRSYFEEKDPTIVTESTPGFFGLDFLFQSLNDSHPEKLCPVPSSPRHVVQEKDERSRVDHSKRKAFTAFQLLRDELSHSVLFGGVLIFITLPWILLNLLLRIFSPRLYLKFNKKDPVGWDSELEFIRPENELPEAGPIQGYSFEEMADRVVAQIKSLGISERLTPLVVLVSHGSSSVNNPHYAAYDCGACSGRPGAANAKTFARMANHIEVRKLAAKKGVIIPETTQFLGAFHDTCRDTLTFFDERFLRPEHLELLVRLKATAQVALEKNAQGRILQFGIFPPNIAPAVAHREVLHRSVALFEPRPEYNHATNAFCIVGRRKLTQGVPLNRRAFLQSYDPTLDPSGEILIQTLLAVVPVCAGINLEYLFSKIDNEVYGSGTKLPHNVASLLGVMNGVDSDLRTGLPKQMIEIHDPVRMLFVIERNALELGALLHKQPELAHWFENRWAFLVSIDPVDHSFRTFVPGAGFKESL